MVYVGMDLHRKRSHVAVVDEHGRQLLSRRLVNDRDVFRELLGELGADAKFALEATYGWEWLAELLEDEGCELHLAHPLRTKAIASARGKTDAVDARTLAHLLRADLLPEVYVAPRELRDLRDLLRQRVVLTHMRSALKNRVHALIARQGVQREHADLFGRGGRRFLDELALRPDPRQRLETLLRLIGDFDREIDALAREIDARAKHDPRVDVLCQIHGIGRYLGMLIVAEIGEIDALAREIDARAKHDPRVDVLCQIHGIGRYLGMLIVAEIGEIDRFPTARHVCAWAGLTPTVRSSDHKARLGHISGLGSKALRWALVEAAQKAVQGGGPLRADFERIAKRRGRKIAKVAIARKILTLCFYGLRDGEIRCLKPPGRASALKVMAPSS